MSLQRIFASARKLGVPVIVTDADGREPFVVLPLEQFEAMAESGEPRSSGRGTENTHPVSRPSVTIEYAPVPSPEDLREERSQEKKVFSDAQKTQLDRISTGMGESAEMSLEERFYLEPIEDKEGM